MKALVLAAGWGTRLRPLTFFTAKVSLPLMNVPFIRYPLQYLHLHEIDEAVINLHAHPETVRTAAGTDYCGMKIHFSNEPEILGTAGAIRKALSLLGEEPFLVMNGDMLTYIPLQQVLEQHRREKADVTMVVMRAELFPRYSSAYFEESEGGPPRLCGFNPGKGQAFHYTGLQIMNPQIADSIPPDQSTDIFRDIYPGLLLDKKIQGFVYDGFWMEIGALNDYLQTNIDLALQPLPVALQPPGMDQTPIAPDAIIENDARIMDSVVMKGATINAGASIERCIIGPEVTVTGKFRYAALARGLLPWYIQNERQRPTVG